MRRNHQSSMRCRYRKQPWLSLIALFLSVTAFAGDPAALVQSGKILSSRGCTTEFIAKLQQEFAPARKGAFEPAAEVEKRMKEKLSPKKFTEFQDWYNGHFFYDRDTILTENLKVKKETTHLDAPRPYDKNGERPFQGYMAAKKQLAAVDPEKLTLADLQNTQRALLSKDSIDESFWSIFKKDHWFKSNSEEISNSGLGVIREKGAYYDAIGDNASKALPLSGDKSAIPLKISDEVLNGNKFLQRRGGVVITAPLSNWRKYDELSDALRAKLEALEKNFPDGLDGPLYDKLAATGNDFGALLARNKSLFAELKSMRREVVTELVQNKLDNLRSALKSAKTEDEVIRAAADFHHDFMSIHPFENGNGRTGRVITESVLNHYGMSSPIWTHFGEDMELAKSEFTNELRDSVKLSDAFHDQLNTLTKAGLDYSITPAPYFSADLLETLPKALRRLNPEEFMTWVAASQRSGTSGKSVSEALHEYAQWAKELSYGPENTGIRLATPLFEKTFGELSPNAEVFRLKMSEFYNDRPIYRGITSTNALSERDVLDHFLHPTSTTVGMGVSANPSHAEFGKIFDKYNTDLTNDPKALNKRISNHVIGKDEYWNSKFASFTDDPDIADRFSHGELMSPEHMKNVKSMVTIEALDRDAASIKTYKKTNRIWLEGIYEERESLLLGGADPESVSKVAVKDVITGDPETGLKVLGNKVAERVDYNHISYKEMAGDKAQERTVVNRIYRVEPDGSLTVEMDLMAKSAVEPSSDKALESAAETSMAPFRGEKKLPLSVQVFGAAEDVTATVLHPIHAIENAFETARAEKALTSAADAVKPFKGGESLAQEARSLTDGISDDLRARRYAGQTDPTTAAAIWKDSKASADERIARFERRQKEFLDANSGNAKVNARAEQLREATNRSLEATADRHSYLAWEKAGKETSWKLPGLDTKLSEAIDNKFKLDAKPALQGKVRIPTLAENQANLRSAAKLWTEARPDKKFLNAVEEIARTGKIEPAVAAEFKAARGRLKIIRFLCEAICEDGVKIKRFDKLTAKIGHLTDAASYGVLEDVKMEATKLRQMLDNGNLNTIDKELAGMKAMSQPALEEHVQSMVQSIRETLGSENLTEKEFHDVRKDIGRLQTIELANALTERGPASAAGNYMGMNNVYNKLRKDHDAMMEATFRDDTALPHRFTPEESQKIESVLSSFESGIKDKAENSLQKFRGNKELTLEEVNDIQRAHEVGRGEQFGKDGVNPPGVGNYTDAQLEKKVEILKDKFTIEERRALIEDGVVGDPVKTRSSAREPASAPSLKPTLVIGPTDDEMDRLLKNGGDLFTLKQRSPKEAKSLNEAALQKLKKEPFENPLSKKKTGLTDKEINKLYDDVAANNQVSESLCGVYNGSPQYGFCWGRAMAAHLKALQTGLPTRNVRKLWAVGNLKADGTNWRYHVTTLVRGKNGTWYAIDPIFKKAMPAIDWYNRMSKEFDRQGTMRIFASPANRFNPQSFAKYNKERLAKAFYYNFFSDLMDGVYTENTGRVGPWKGISEDTSRRLKFESLMQKSLWTVGGGVIATWSYLMYSQIQNLNNQSQGSQK